MRYETKGKRNIDLGYDIPENKELSIIDNTGSNPSFITLGNRKVHITSKLPEYIDVELVDKPIKEANSEILQAAGAFDVGQEVNAIIQKQNAIKQAFAEIMVFKNEIDRKLAEHQIVIDGKVAEIVNKQELDKKETDSSLITLSNGVKLNSKDIKNILGIVSVLEKKAEDTDGNIKDIVSVLTKHEHPKATKESVGLGNADNTSDIDKPISKATQNALDTKVSVGEFNDLVEKITKLQKKQKDFQRGIDSLGGMGIGTVNLEGGKKGQVLFKKSDQSGDFEWRDSTTQIDDELSLTSEYPVQNKVITSSIIIKSKVIPTATQELVGTEYQYTGETNQTYTHGYIYECVSSTVYNEAIYFEPHKVAFDYDVGTLEHFFKDNNINDYLDVTHGTMTYYEAGDIWALEGLDADNNIVFTGLQLYTQDLIDYGFVFINPMTDFEDEEVIDFETTFTPVVSYVWTRIDLQPDATIGRFLSLWDCATGLAVTNPPESPYVYKTGDYFVVSNISNSTNYKPNGLSYTTGVASTTIETEDVKAGDTYFFDGTAWKLQKNTGGNFVPYTGANSSVDLNAQDLKNVGNLAVNGAINSNTDVKVNGVSLQLPSRTGNQGKFLTTDGSSLSWANVSSGSDANVKVEGSGGGSSEDLDLSEVYVDDMGASYGFEYDSMENTITNTNKDVDDSFAYGKISITVPTATTMTVYFKQSSEVSYDFGELSILDENLSVDDEEDSSDILAFDGYYYDEYEGSVEYNLSEGTHFITFKYIKDESSYSGEDLFSITRISLSSSGASLRLINTETQEEIPVSQLGDLPVVLDEIRASIPEPIDTSDFVTISTTQKIQAAKAIFGTDVAFGSDTTQKNLLAVVSNNNSTAGNWTGRLTVGAKNKTFIMGTYGSICVLGAHSWTNAQQGTGAAWEDVYINPDGNKAVYIGGSPINGKQCLLKIQNVNYNTTGTVQINRSSNLSNNFKNVACWDDSVAKFDFTQISGYNSSVNQTLTHDSSGNLKWVNS